MGLFIIVGLLISLILTEISLCYCPFLCSIIGVSFKKNKDYVVCSQLLLAIILYIIACVILEQNIDGWCYLVYAGIVLTPIVLYFCAGIEGSDTSKVSEIMSHNNRIAISIITIITSLMFAVEGCLRMSHSKSVHYIILNSFIYPEIDSHSFYYDELQYTGGLMFSVSLLSCILIGLSALHYFKESCDKDTFEIKNYLKLIIDIRVIVRNLKNDSKLLESLESQQKNNLLLLYNSFCQKLIEALDSSDEKSEISYEFGGINNKKSYYKMLLISSKRISCYFYPMCIVVKSHDNKYEYFHMDKDTISFKNEHKSKYVALPSDVRPIRQFRLQTTAKNKGNRNNINPKIYIYNYGILKINELFLHIYRANAAKELVSSYNQLYLYLSKIKELKHIHNIEFVQEVNSPVSDRIIDNADIVKKVIGVKSSKQSFSGSSLNTLEDCFIDIILNRGIDILSDKNIASVINLSYKKLKFEDYKDVLERMANENFLYQFTEVNKQNDFALYNLSNNFAYNNKINAQKALFVTHALVSAIKKVSR